jgi:hypothetical protein
LHESSEEEEQEENELQEELELHDCSHPVLHFRSEKSVQELSDLEKLISSIKSRAGQMMNA